MKRKLLALLLLFTVCLGSFQITAMAADTTAATDLEEETDPVLAEHQEFLDELKALQETKDYDAVIEQAEAFLRKNPDSPLYGPIEKVCIQSYVRKARALIDSKHREDAEELLNECADRYADSEYLYIVEKDQQALKDLLKKEIPKTGKVFHNNSTVHGGYGKLIIKNSGTKRLVKIEVASGKNKGQYISVFVRPNAKAEVNIQPGKYILKTATGKTWYSSTEWFGSEMDCEQWEGTFEFAKLPQYTTWTITCGVSGGNMGSTPISKSDF
ncbi:MAG: tetratricopeptide repeat protein [Oscillospiraceae bacterium]|nr:tetratricopeptide repeat protein [Oscillospiraceae bacterium]